MSAARHVTRVRKLYKLILRLHRNLPDNLRVLGDLYAKEEFKRHKKCRPQEARTFLYEWQDYAANMLRQAAPVRAQCSTHEGKVVAGLASTKVGETRFGSDLPPEAVDSMTPDHLFNLQMLLEHSGGEPDDAGIDLIKADTFANNVNKAKKYIFELEKLEKLKIERGEMKVEDKTFKSNDLLKIFDIAVVGSDTVDEVISIAVERVELLKKAADKDKKEAEEAKKEAVGDKKEEINTKKVADKDKTEAEEEKKEAMGDKKEEIDTKKVADEDNKEAEEAKKEAVGDKTEEKDTEINK